MFSHPKARGWGFPAAISTRVCLLEQQGRGHEVLPAPQPAQTRSRGIFPSCWLQNTFQSHSPAHTAHIKFLIKKNQPLGRGGDGQTRCTLSFGYFSSVRSDTPKFSLEEASRGRLYKINIFFHVLPTLSSHNSSGETFLADPFLNAQAKTPTNILRAQPEQKHVTLKHAEI